MGIMSFFRKKTPSHEEKIATAYGCFKPDMVELIFPKKQYQAGCIVTSLANICGFSLEACDAERYLAMLSVYADIMLHMLIKQTSCEMIVSLLQMKRKDIATTADKARLLVAYTFLNMKNNYFTIVDDTDMKLVQETASNLAERKPPMNDNATAMKYLNDPDYGLVAQKPIFTHTLVGLRTYLSRLVTTDGVELTWERVGTTTCEGIKGITDIYEGYLPSRKLYKTLYLNMYGMTDSETAPVGFRLK